MTNTAPFTCDVSFESPAQVCVLALVGKLDALASEDLETRVKELRRAGHRRFVFDLSKLDYVGSLGLRIFVALHNELHGDGAVCFCGASSNVRSIFAVTRLDQLLRSYPSRADAVDASRT